MVFFLRQAADVYVYDPVDHVEVLTPAVTMVVMCTQTWNNVYTVSDTVAVTLAYKDAGERRIGPCYVCHISLPAFSSDSSLRDGVVDAQCDHCFNIHRDLSL
jgi:hypothetical protein